MLVEFHAETNTLLIIPENRQECRSVQLLYELMVSWAETSRHDAEFLYLRSDGVLEILPLLPSTNWEW